MTDASPIPPEPEAGHRFRFTVSSAMSSRVEEPGKPPTPYSDADWWSEPWTLTVRARGLHAALRVAADVPITEWRRADGRKVGDPRETSS